MRVLWLSLLLFLVNLTFARHIVTRRLDPDPVDPVEIMVKEQDVYDNLNILRDLTLTTESIWDFEGVNYDDMVGEINNQHNDCFGISISCTLAMGHIRPVCGYHNKNGKSYDRREKYATICDLDYRNCLYRVRNKKPAYGTDDLDGNDYMEWAGEGNTCIQP